MDIVGLIFIAFVAGYFVRGGDNELKIMRAYSRGRARGAREQVAVQRSYVEPASLSDQVRWH